MLRKMGYLNILALAVLSLAGPARAGEQVSFEGHGSGVLYADFTISGVGEVSHLGRMAFAADAMGHVTFTAANDDKVFIIGVGSKILDATHVLNSHVIVGGTGRFQDATGSFTTLLEFAFPLFATPPPPSAFPISFSWVLEGAISSPGANE